MLIVKDDLHKKISAVYLAWKPRITHFTHTVSNRQTNVRTAILNYRKALLLKKNCPIDKRVRPFLDLVGLLSGFFVFA